MGKNLTPRIPIAQDNLMRQFGLNFSASFHAIEIVLHRQTKVIDRNPAFPAKPEIP
jgi:hypothetical protein